MDQLVLSTKSFEFKLPEEWDRELYKDTQIYDPDGWRGSRFKPWNEPLTKDDFEQRRVFCTIGPRR